MFPLQRMLISINGFSHSLKVCHLSFALETNLLCYLIQPPLHLQAPPPRPSSVTTELVPCTTNDFCNLPQHTIHTETLTAPPHLQHNEIVRGGEENEK